MTGDITTIGGDANTKATFKNCAPFTRCVACINDEHGEKAENLDIIMPIYNLLEHSDDYADSSGSLWQFKRDEQSMTDARNPDNVATNDSSSVADGANRAFKNEKSSSSTKIPIQLF